MNPICSCRVHPCNSEFMCIHRRHLGCIHRLYVRLVPPFSGMPYPFDPTCLAFCTNHNAKAIYWFLRDHGAPTGGRAAWHSGALSTARSWESNRYPHSNADPIFAAELDRIDGEIQQERANTRARVLPPTITTAHNVELRTFSDLQMTSFRGLLAARATGPPSNWFRRITAAYLHRPPTDSDWIRAGFVLDLATGEWYWNEAEGYNRADDAEDPELAGLAHWADSEGEEISTCEPPPSLRCVPFDPTAQCPICIESTKFDDYWLAGPCGHAGHPTCLVRWISRSNQCPVCRFKPFA